MSTRKRLLVLTTTFPRWKGDKEPPFVFELCRRLTDRFDIFVLAPHTKGALTHEVMDGIEVIRFRYSPAKWERLAYSGGVLSNLKLNPLCYCLLPTFFLSQLISLCAILKRQKIDAIHAHWLLPQGLSAAVTGLLIKRMPPVLCTSHGGDILGLNAFGLPRLKRWALNQIQFLTVVSHALVGPSEKLGARLPNVAVIPMGIDTKNIFLPSSEQRESYTLLFVGRLVEKKGLTYLIAALPDVLIQYPETRLDIVGSGPEECRLRKQVASLGLSGSVHFHGAIANANIAPFYQRASILIMPSIVTKEGDQEGLGLVLAEALACECPVIASDLPAIRDVIINQLSGWLVPEKDPSALGKAITELFSQPDLRRKLGKDGRIFVAENFDWNEISDRYGELLLTLANAPANQSASSREYEP